MDESDDEEPEVVTVVGGYDRGSPLIAPFADEEAERKCCNTGVGGGGAGSASSSCSSGLSAAGAEAEEAKDAKCGPVLPCGASPPRK
jgi:hypothetical protein